jgi:hypothetical protein
VLGLLLVDVATMALSPTGEPLMMDAGVVIPVKSHRLGVEAVVLSEVSAGQVCRVSGERRRSQGHDQYQGQKCCRCATHVYHRSISSVGC